MKFRPYLRRALDGLDGRLIRTALVIDVVAGLFLAVIGPFNTGLGSITVRVVYWETVLLLGSAIGVLTNVLIDAAVDPQGRRPFLVAVISSLVMSAPTTVVVFGATRLTYGWAAAASLLDLWPPVVVICLGMSLVNALAHRSPLVTHAVSEPAQPPRFLERLPPRLRGGEIHAVKAEDHYLRVHTSRGSDLILMRLSDAVAELEGLEGAQTHRSWWVARNAVQSVSKRDGRAVLRLTGDLEAPVSRNFARALRADGWLD